MPSSTDKLDLAVPWCGRGLLTMHRRGVGRTTGVILHVFGPVHASGHGGHSRALAASMVWHHVRRYVSRALARARATVAARRTRRGLVAASQQTRTLRSLRVASSSDADKPPTDASLYYACGGRGAASAEQRIVVQRCSNMAADKDFYRRLRVRDMITRRDVGRLAVGVAAVLMLAPPCLHAQAPAAAVGLGFGVDTTVTVVHQIVDLTRAYLAHPDSTARARGLWSASTPLDARVGDVAANAYQGFKATIVAVTPAFPGDSVYVVKILHATSSTTGKPVSALALQRLFAVPAPSAPFGWQLADALPRLTRHWPTQTVGRITFHYAPGQVQSATKAARAARFVDSVATLFAVAPPPHIDAYVTSSTDEAQRAVGLDFFPDGSGPGTGFGARSYPRAALVLIGDPRVGEDYLHEFVHVVLTPTLRGQTAVFNEGVAVWLGGHDGHPALEMYRELRQYQAEHSTVTMAQVLSGAAPGGAAASDAMYTTGAVIMQTIYERSGIAGVRRFASVSGTVDQQLAALPEYVGPVGRGGLDAWWRAETAKLVAR